MASNNIEILKRVVAESPWETCSWQPLWGLPGAADTGICFSLCIYLQKDSFDFCSYCSNNRNLFGRERYNVIHTARIKKEKAPQTKNTLFLGCIKKIILFLTQYQYLTSSVKCERTDMFKCISSSKSLKWIEQKTENLFQISYCFFLLYESRFLHQLRLVIQVNTWLAQSKSSLIQGLTSISSSASFGKSNLQYSRFSFNHNTSFLCLNRLVWKCVPGNIARETLVMKASQRSLFRVEK